MRTIPKRFLYSEFENYNPVDATQAQAKAVMQSRPAGSYYLHGDYSRGKTHLLYAQYRALITTGRRCLVRTTKEILDELMQAEIDRDKGSALLNALSSSCQIHVFWDDCDKLKPTDFKEEALFNLIDTIYRGAHSLTMTSNCDLVELQKKLTPAMVRRIDDICTVVRV
jgi:DNA replication protein DnaC